MVTDEVWSKAWPDERGMLCIGCLEVLLGRMLNALDFTDAPINTAYQERSARLIDRLTSDV
jgi:hypothetical protein